MGFDCDGVIYDFVDALRQWLHHDKGKPHHEMPDANMWDFYKHQWGMTTQDFLECYADGINAGHIFSIGDPFEGVVEAMHKIKSLGHEIYIVTARNIPGAEENAEKYTRLWLDKHEVPHDDLVISADKTIVETDIFIDDHYDNYVAIEEAGGYPWLITRPWNMQHRGARRVFDYEEFVEKVNILSRAG